MKTWTDLLECRDAKLHRAAEMNALIVDLARDFPACLLAHFACPEERLTVSVSQGGTCGYGNWTLVVTLDVPWAVKDISITVPLVAIHDGKAPSIEFFDKSLKEKGSWTLLDAAYERLAHLITERAYEAVGLLFLPELADEGTTSDIPRAIKAA